MCVCVCVCPLHRYPDHEPVAPLWRVVCAGLLDAVFAAVTLGGSALVSALLVLATARRQTAGQLIAGVHCVKERACGNAVVPRVSTRTHAHAPMYTLRVYVCVCMHCGCVWASTEGRG